MDAVSGKGACHLVLVRSIGDHFYPIVTYSDIAQVDDPQLSQASGDHQIAQALWIRQVAFMQKESTAFLVREKGFDL